MDTRKVSTQVRRRVGQPSTAYARSFEGGVLRSAPMGTDWAAIEAVFEAKAQAVRARALQPVGRIV